VVIIFSKTKQTTEDTEEKQRTQRKTTNFYLFFPSFHRSSPFSLLFSVNSVVIIFSKTKPTTEDTEEKQRTQRKTTNFYLFFPSFHRSSPFSLLFSVDSVVNFSLKANHRGHRGKTEDTEKKPMIFICFFQLSWFFSVFSSFLR